METPQHLPKWLPWVGVGIVVMLVLRARSSGGSSRTAGLTGQAAVRTDVNSVQAQAQALQLQSAKDESAYQQAIRALDLNQRQAQAQVSGDYAALYHDVATGAKYPGGFQCASGKPRIDPATGQIYCRTNKGGGLTAGSLIRVVTNVLTPAPIKPGI